MSDVLRLAPTAQALENVPHMLRYWADVIERDQEAGVKTDLAALILVQETSSAPAFFISGATTDAPHHPLYVAGIFDWCRAKLIEVIEQDTLHDGEAGR